MTIGAAADSDMARTFVQASSLNTRQRVVLPGLLLYAARSLLEQGAARDRACHAFFVPGRIELLGKHTDYGGGPSLVCAVERGLVVIACARDDDRVTVTDARSGERAAIEPLGDTADAPGWSRYPGAVVRRVAHDFPAARGADIAFFGNIPVAAGLGSSSTLVVATFLALDAVHGVRKSAAYTAAINSTDQLAEYLAAIERGAPFGSLDAGDGVGTLSGCEDHVAMLCAEPGRIQQYSYLPAVCEASVHCPDDLIFTVATTGVTAEKAGAAMEHYNRLARQIASLEELWQRHDGDDARTLRDILRAPLGAERLRDIVSWHGGASTSELLARLAQFQEETQQLIPQALDALRGSDHAALHEAARRSQQLAEDVLENQIEETSWLAASAERHGAAAASAFGAGFGGSVWAIVRRDRAATFMDGWRAAYVDRFPQHSRTADFWLTEAGGAAVELG